MDKEDVKDVLLAMLHNYYGRLQHYESQRAVVTNLVIVVTAAILAFVTFDQKLTIGDAPLILLLLLLGIFGAAFCAKYYERAVRIFDRLQAIRDKLDAELFGFPLISDLLDKIDKQHEIDFRPFFTGSLSYVKVHRLWIAFHLIIAVLAVILLILIPLV